MSFRHGEDTLVGDLDLPAGPAPHPAILFVHGSGPASRHGSLYASMKNEFLGRGFATLVWSKPGVDESSGDYLEQSMDDRAGEVDAAMGYLAARPDIDADRIGLWGGSQAGWVVPKVAARREVAFMILLSCPVDGAMSQTLYLAENVLALLGIPEGERPEALDQVRSYYELIRSSGTHEEFLRGQEVLLAEAKQRAWYARIEHPEVGSESWLLDPESSWLLRLHPIDRKRFQFLHRMFADDAPPRLDVLRAPLLAIYGTSDIVVDWKLGSDAYRGVPRLAGNPDVTVEIFAGADHSLQQPDREGYLDFAPGVLSTMGDWLSKHR